MAIQAIIWDIGGVLERTEDFTPRRILAQRLGWELEPLMDLIFGSRDGYRVQLGQISYQQHLQNLQQALGQTEGELQITLREFFAGDRLDTHLVEEIRRLRASYTTAVLSNYSPILREKINHTWQISDAFDHLVISAEVGVKKPDPEIYRLVMEQTGCQFQEAVFIDDAPENIAAARALGIHTVHFQHPSQAINEINTLLRRQNQNSA